ncbi:hypothetical protein GH714_013599 [Hevea brasiliensis]|uniref:Uncharacterized protein n=1 Tax=Hevea brasiliensis TaxID=3981 RepID=A0A6A6MKK0_HEVBR|nr:hypothetical protein GH714_013599 [Hevea brasiliensis]
MDGCGGGGADAFNRGALVKCSDLQSSAAELMPAGDLVFDGAIKHLLQQVERAEALPLWVPEEPKPETSNHADDFN